MGADRKMEIVEKRCGPERKVAKTPGAPDARITPAAKDHPCGRLNSDRRFDPRISNIK